MSVAAPFPTQMQNQDSNSDQEALSNNDASSSEIVSPTKLKNNPNLCSNKICQFYKPTKYNLTHQNNAQNLCPECVKQYENEAYCIYCKQIYFQFTDDGKEWIMCDECQRWVHTECADFYVGGTNTIFNCIKCKKIEVPLTGSTAVPNRRNVGVARGNTNAKVPERRKTQQCMLNNFGFYWQLSPAELAEDVQKLKQFLK